MTDFKPPKELQFTGNLCEHFRRFKQNLNIYFKAAGHNEADPEVKASMLLNLMGEEAVERFNTFNLTDEQRKDYDTVLQAFEEYMTPRKNTVMERFNFNTRVQGEHELFDDFITDLKKLVKTCEFGDLTNSVIVDRIVLGAADKSLQEKLLRIRDLDLEKAVETCKSAESSKRQAAAIQGNQQEVLVIKNKVYQNRNKIVPNREVSQPQTSEAYSCQRCGRRHGRARCPAIGKTCLLCGAIGHFAVVCRVRTQNQRGKAMDSLSVFDREEGNSESETDDKEFLITTVKVLDLGSWNKEQWIQNVKVEKTVIPFKLDTGAETNVLPSEFLPRFKNKIKLRSTPMILEAFGGAKIKPLGTVNLCCKIEGSNVFANLDFAVVDSADTETKPILGLVGCVRLDLVKRVNVGAIANNQTSRDTFIEKHSEIFEGIGKFKTKCKISLKDNIEPVVRPPRRVPEALKGRLKTMLDSLEKQRIITKVDHPDGWVSNLVIVEKANGTLRCCLDPQDLNKAIKREHCLIPTLEEITPKLCNKEAYTVLDLKDGFWHVELDKESSKLCTFSSPYGCYKFNRLPFGISIAPEVFQRMNENNFGDIPGVVIYFDDLLVAGESLEEHDRILKQVVERAKKLNIRFNKDKLQYRRTEVKFLGQVFSKKGIRPDPDRIKAIQNLEEPTNKTDLQRIMGMVNYLRSYIPNMSDITAPLRELLKNKVDWLWLPIHTQAMNEIKNKISNAPVLRNFNSQLPITIQADSSKDGLGCCLLQEGQPIAFASRSLTDAEKNYAQVEKEFLAIIFATGKFHHYIYGRTVKVLTDHKPLVAIMKKNITQVLSTRLQRMKLKLLRYSLDVTYLQGKLMFVADLLSRSYIKEAGPDDPELIEIVHSLTKNINMTEARKHEFRQHTKNDPVLSILCDLHQEGWPTMKKDLPDRVKFYYKLQDSLNVEDGLVFLNDRIIVPLTLRNQMLDLLHQSHFGMEKTVGRARQIMYWPGMSAEIQNMIAKCTICERYRPANMKEPLISHEVPNLPFEKVGVDICEYGGKAFLVLACYLTKWLEIKPLKAKSAEEVVYNLKEIFSTHGSPRTLISDNVPFASNLFRKFAKDWEIEIITSSPHYPRSNGFAEKMVGVAKNIIKKTLQAGQDIFAALTEYRNSPITGLDVSPAQMLMSRRVRTKLPISNPLLEPRLQQTFKIQLQRKQNKQAYYYNRMAHTRPSFEPNDSVLVQKGKNWEHAQVLSKHDQPRSYLIKDQTGQTLRRNKVHLRKSHNPFVMKPEESDDPPEELDNKRNEAPLELNNGENERMKESSHSAGSNYFTRSGRRVVTPSYLKDFVLRGEMLHED